MTEPPQEPDDSSSPSRGRRRLVLVAVRSLLLLLVGAAIGVAAVHPRSAPSDTSAEAGFARDMQVHHAQAVDMAMIIRDRSDDRAIRYLAYDIALTQQEQIGEMHGWLAQWRLPQTGKHQAMAWMSDHAGHRDSTTSSPMAMPGMATTTQLQRLRELRGEEAEILFLTLMIHHHRGGVAMARAVVVRTNRPEVRELAKTMVAGQTKEINQMQGLLVERGAPRA